MNNPDPRIGACAYLLHGLLQRLEHQSPGLLSDMIEGVESDRDANSRLPSPEAAHGVEIADEALRMLRLARAQLDYANALSQGMRPPKSS